MIRMIRISRAVGVYALSLLPAMPTGLSAQSQDLSEAQSQATAVAWCLIDDPAAWREARQALINDGAAPPFDIVCPEAVTGRTIPPVLYLPMPCERAMIFQRVDVPATHPLDQVEGNFGRAVDVAAETPQTVLSNGAWRAPVAGVFSILDGEVDATSDALDALRARAYYMARYELTEVQWRIFEFGLFDLPAAATRDAAAPACADLDAWLGERNLRDVRPAAGLSWFDAIAFSRAYSRWLVVRDAERIAAGEAPDLPWEQGSTGYVRLPTEAEWEYAARGGASQVTSQARSVRMPVIREADGETLRPADLAEVCAETPLRAGEYVTAVGLKAPNALGLYDVVCNAEEIVLDLFRPTRPDGLGGQVGGVITKGGTSRIFRSRNTVGRRTEATALFDLGGEGATATMGTRLAISAPAFVGRRDGASAPEVGLDDYTEGRANVPFQEALMTGRVRLLENGVGLAEGSSEELSAEVNRLRRSLSEGRTSEQQLAEQAERLQLELERLDAQRAGEARAATLLAIRTGVVTANLIDRMGRNVYAAMVRMHEYSEADDLVAAERQRLAALETMLPTLEGRIQASFDLYMQIHSELGDRQPDFVARQIAASRDGVGGLSVEIYGEYLDRFEAHREEVRAERGRLTEEIRASWLDQLDETRERRRREFPRLQP